MPSAIDVDELIAGSGGGGGGGVGAGRLGEGGDDGEEQAALAGARFAGVGAGRLGEGDDGEGARDGATVAEVAAGMAEVHPNASDTDAFPRTLARYLKKNGAAEGGEEELLKKIAAAHSRWIGSGAWDAEGGRYAPKLKNWLWGGNWKQKPPERREGDGRDGARPSRDEGFHAGASL